MRSRNSVIYARVYSTDFSERSQREPALSLCHRTERCNFYRGMGIRLVAVMRAIRAVK